MIVWGKQCVKCHEIIWSRAGHDFKNCACGSTYVDGGQGEFGGRVGWSPGFEPVHVVIKVHGLTKNEQYQDWNLGRREGYDVLGRIARGTVDLRQQIVSIGDIRFDGKPRADSDDDGTVC